MELPGFPGVFVCIHGGDIGQIADTRDMKTAPTVNNLLKYNCHQLKSMWTTAIKEQMKALTEAEGFHWGVIRGGMSSVSELFVAQMQDYLGLGAGHRMNIPGTQSGNWQWRLLPGELTPELAEKIRRMTVLYGRADRPEEQAEEPSEQSETAQEA